MGVFGMVCQLVPFNYLFDFVPIEQVKRAEELRVRENKDQIEASLKAKRPWF